MKQIVIMPGGFHPFHAGHAALYQSAVKAFPNAEVYVAATNDTKTRPFPFSIKEKLAKLAGVADKHFVQVKSPFKAEEITSHYNPNEDVLIFIRSEKDKTEQPKPGGTKKDGSPAYFQPWTGKNLQPFSKHAYIAYLPTVEFGPGITSATEIRNAWPALNDKRKTAMVMSLYPTTQKNPKLAANVVKMLDMGMGNDVTETINKVEPISKPVTIQKTITQPKQHMHTPPEKKTPAVVNHIKPREVKEADARIFHPQYVDVYYLDGPRRTPILVNRKVPYNLVDRYLELAIKKYNLQQGRFEFRNAEEEKVAEGLGIPYPTTYEQENNKFKSRGPMRITDLTEVNQDYLNEE